MKYTLTICLIFLSFILFAQQPDYLLKENSVWWFGSGDVGEHQGVGIKFFGNGTPKVFSTNAGGYGEGQATVSDTDGNLLFYTNGSIAFDAQGNVMPHGDTLITDLPFLSYWYSSNRLEPTTSTAQGALIIPVIGTQNLYYIFSL